MCGRYTLTADRDAIAARFMAWCGAIRLPDNLPRRYNIAPSQQALVILPTRSGCVGTMMRWGLIPPWSQGAGRAGRGETSGAVGNRARGGTNRASAGFINARLETVAEKPAFREALRFRRCLVPADGFYEWRRDDQHKTPQSKPQKTAFYFRLRSGTVFAFAGIWEKGPDGTPGFAILTTAANDRVRPVHDRMPVILSPDAESLWLDPAMNDPAGLLPLLAPITPDRAALPIKVANAGDPYRDMEAYRVSSLVNSPHNDLPACVEPVR